jgi:hypothetical protein
MLTASPLHAWQEHPRLGALGTFEANEADIGSAAHDLFLHGEERIVVVDADSWRTNKAKDERDAARAAGKIPMLAIKMPAVNAMALRAHRFIEQSQFDGIFERGAAERTIVWKETGPDVKHDIYCRARPDFMTHDYDLILHYKTTSASARADKFIRGIMQNMGYGFSLRFYARGLSQIIQPTPHTHHLMLVQEQDAPYACTLIGLTPAKAQIEDDRVKVAINKWQHCIADDHWPDYDHRIHYAEPTPWELAEAEGEMLATQEELP